MSTGEVLLQARGGSSFAVSFLDQERRKVLLAASILLGLLLVACLCALSFGTLTIEPSKIIALLQGKISDPFLEGIVFNVRLPRLFLAILAGGALAIAGASLQIMFGNPLADPGLIGVSSGAMVFVVLGIFFGQSLPVVGSLMINHPGYFYPVLAFTGAFTMGSFVFKMSQVRGRTDVGTMLLIGIAINAFAGAFSGLMIYLSNDQQLRSINFWMLGSLNGANWSMIGPLAVLVILGAAFLYREGAHLDALVLGDKEARFTGIDVVKLKKTVLMLSALLAGSIISFTGLLGFVGLVVPHILRMIIGPKFKPLVICSFLAGALLLTVSDVLAKVLAAPSELPIGVMTALFGSPYLFFLIHKKKGSVQ